MLKRDISKALLRFKTEQVTGCTMYLKTTNESLQENVIPNRKCKKIWLKCSIKTEQYCLLFCNILILWHRWSLQTTLCCHLRTHKPSGFWKGPSLLPELVLPLSTQLRVLNNLLHDELEGDPTPPHPHHCPRVLRDQCLLHHQHLPWVRGWRGRAGCPGWMVRRPWRCKDRRCCCCNCCICKSCCWKANCWVATCCCWKKSGRGKKKKRMRWPLPREGEIDGGLQTPCHQPGLRVVTRASWKARAQGRLQGDRAEHLWRETRRRGVEALSPAGSHRKTICQSRQFLLWLERPEFLQAERGLLDSETCNEAHEKSGFTTRGLDGFEPWTLRCEGASCLCPACTGRSF